MTQKRSAKDRKRKGRSLSRDRRRRLQKVKKFIVKNSVGLSSIVVSILTAFLVYYLAYSEPDIRPVTELNTSAEFSQPTRDKDGNCFYYGLIKQTFKNLSIKSGHIDNVIFEPLGPADVIPEFKLISVEKTRFGWREEKEIDIVYSMTLSPSACTVMSSRDDFLSVGINLYDNTGKLLDRDLSGGKAHMSMDLPFRKVTGSH